VTRNIAGFFTIAALLLGVGTSTASFNNLNQFSTRTVPGYAQSLGSAHSNATVTVNLAPTERKGDYLLRTFLTSYF
jgi:hypothetical protein